MKNVDSFEARQGLGDSFADLFFRGDVCTHGERRFLADKRCGLIRRLAVSIDDYYGCALASDAQSKSPADPSSASCDENDFSVPEVHYSSPAKPQSIDCSTIQFH